MMELGDAPQKHIRKILPPDCEVGSRLYCHVNSHMVMTMIEIFNVDSRNHVFMIPILTDSIRNPNVLQDSNLEMEDTPLLDRVPDVQS